MSNDLCSDCPPVGYGYEKTRCLPCPRRRFPQVEQIESQQEPMAVLHWDFASPHPCVRIKGSTEIRSASDAAKIRDLMNKEHGERSHWVETLNWSWEERHRAEPA